MRFSLLSLLLLAPFLALCRVTKEGEDLKDSTNSDMTDLLVACDSFQLDPTFEGFDILLTMKCDLGSGENGAFTIMLDKYLYLDTATTAIEVRRCILLKFSFPAPVYEPQLIHPIKNSGGKRESKEDLTNYLPLQN